MPIPEKVTLYHEKNLLDRVIDNVASQENALSASDLNRVSVAAQIQQGIDNYRLKAQSMTEDELTSEAHNSSLLGWHLEQSGKKRPPRCHAHAIVAGKHANAARLRLIMAVLKIRIDDTDNGCWLPENTAATPHPAFPSAPPHSRIHRYNYFSWLVSRLGSLRNEGLFRTNLQIIADLLQQGKLPPHVMQPKGVSAPKNGKLK